VAGAGRRGRQTDRGGGRGGTQKVPGYVTRDNRKAGKPVVGVYLHSDQVTDAVLANLGAFPQLQKLSVFNAKITNKGSPP